MTCIWRRQTWLARLVSRYLHPRCLSAATRRNEMKGRLLVLGAVVLATACKPDTPSDAAAAPANAGRGAPSADTGATKTAGTPSGGGAPGAASGGRGRTAAVITLAASDVATIQPTTIEDVTPISGDLRPIETLAVRSRVDGVVDAVLVREGEVVRQGQL